MKKIIIGEEREYARRLSNYLLRHLPADIQLYSYTNPQILAEEEKADLYLLGEDFYEELLMLEPEFSGRDILLISSRQAEEGFSRLDPPKKLVRQIREFTGSGNPSGKNSSDVCQLIALYAPFPDISLRRWIWRKMETGDVYLGLQDMGETGDAAPSDNSAGDMGSLCYYIHLHEAEILEKMQKMLLQEEGKLYLESPSWFFDSLGLTEEDYRWFFHTLREDSAFSKVYIGLGNSAIPSLEYFSIFDRIILLDRPWREKIHTFCERFARTVVAERYVAESSLEVRDCSGAERKATGLEEPFETGIPF